MHETFCFFIFLVVCPCGRPTGLRLHARCLGFGQFQGRDPALALHFAAGLQVIGLCSTVGDDKVAGVVHGDGCCGQVDCASTRVAHLCLGPDSHEVGRFDIPGGKAGKEKIEIFHRLKLGDFSGDAYL